MEEDIFAPIFTLDEAKTFVFVKPLDCSSNSFGHSNLLFFPVINRLIIKTAYPSVG